MGTAAQPRASVSGPGGDEIWLERTRLRLRHDVVFADVGNGVFLRDAAGGMFVKGNSAYRLTASLVPFLTGEHSVGDLCSALPVAHRDMVTSLLRSLLDRGFVRDVRPSTPARLDEAVHDRFRPQVNYIEHYVDDAVARFARFRSARVLILGTGPIAVATGLALLRNGMQVVSLASWEGSAPAPADLVDQAGQLSEAGCPAEVRLLDTAVPDLDAPAIAPYELVAVPADRFGLADLARLSMLCATGGPALLPAAVVGNLAVLGPLQRPDSSPCWVCATLRLGANLEPSAVAAMWRDVSLPAMAGSAPAASAPLAAMIGNLMGYEIFRALTDSLRPETDGGVVVQDLTTMETVRERLHSHPLCPACGGGEPDPAGDLPSAAALESPAAATTGAEVTEELRSEVNRTAELVGSHVGVLTRFEDAAIDQSPLKVARVRIGPADRSTAAPRTVTAFDLYNLVRARLRVVHNAALVYVEQVASVRAARTGSAATLVASGRRPVAHRHLATGSGLPAGEQLADVWLPATSLLTGLEYDVPAAAVYPFGHHNVGRAFEPTSAGCGAGAELTTAIRDGLLSAVAYEALRRGVSGAPGRRLVPEPREPGSEIEFLLRTVRNLGLAVELVALPVSGPAHVVAARSGVDGPAPAWAIGSALSRPTAIVEALRDLAGTAQLQQRQPGAEGPVDLGDPLLGDLDVRALRVAGTATGDAVPATVRDVLEHLHGEGRDALVAQTTPPDLHRQGSVATVRVLLTAPADRAVRRRG